MIGPTFDRTGTQTANWTELPNSLHSLWDKCMHNLDCMDVARALTMNLIAIADAGNEESLREVTKQLQRHMPCRAFLILIDEQADSQTAELSATTRSHDSIHDIVLEEIVLRLREKDLPLIPGLLRPLIIDDLPSHLYWSLSWPGNEQQLDTIAQLCQHAIVDSQLFGNPALELPIIKQRCQDGQGLTDLNWLRVQPWRRALAESFQRFDWQPDTAVKGIVRHGKNARATSMLLADWLHERLAASIVMDPEGNPDSVGPDHVSLQIALASGSIEIVIDLDRGKLVTHVTTQSHCYLPFRSAALRGNNAKLISLAIDAT